MKTLITPKYMPSYVAKAVDQAIPLAYGFLCAKYGWRFDDVVLVVQHTASRSRYFDNVDKPHDVYGHQPVATIHPHQRLYLYEKNSLGRYKQGVNMGYAIVTACSIIHELTHHVQHLEKRGYSELETTANELEFLRVSFPDWYKLVMVL